MMKMDKRIMNAERIHHLQTIAEINHDTVVEYVSIATFTEINKVRQSIERFKELGLIIFKDEEYFHLSEKGKKFLETVKYT